MYNHIQIGGEEMIHELVQQSFIDCKTQAFLLGLAVDAGELTDQEIGSYIVFILVALEKRNKEDGPSTPISRKVKASDEYKKIESLLGSGTVDEHAINTQLNTLIRTSTGQFQNLNTKMRAETKKRKDDMKGDTNKKRFEETVNVYDFQEEYNVLMKIKKMEKNPLKTTYNQILRNHLKNISFKSYHEFVAFLREDAGKYENEDLRYISSYLIEKSLNFETHKLMCTIYHRSKEEFDENGATSVVFDIFLLVLMLPMLPVRRRILEKIEHRNKEELIDLRRGIKNSLYFYNAVITNVMNTMENLQNAEADEKDIEIYKTYFQFESLSNDYSIRKDFTASDFADILGLVEAHNKSHNSLVEQS